MNAQTLTAIETARLGGLLEPQTKRLQVRLLSEMAEQLEELATNGGSGPKLVTVADDAAFAALTSEDVKVGDFVYRAASDNEPFGNSVLWQYTGFDGYLPNSSAGYTVIPLREASPWVVEFFAASTTLAAAAALVNGNNIEPYFVDANTVNAAEVNAPTVNAGDVNATNSINAGTNLNAVGDIYAGASVVGLFGIFSQGLNIPIWTVGTLPAPNGVGQLCVVTDCTNPHGSTTRGYSFNDVGGMDYCNFLFSRDAAGLEWVYA